MEKPYKNLGFYLLLLVPLTIFGFYKTYIIKFPDFDERIDIWLHLHALLATLWIILLILQPLLIRYKRRATHRLIGKVSYFLFPLLVLSLIPQIIINNRDGDSNFLTIFNGTLLTVFYMLAIINRKNVGKHMRYMIALALVFVQPTLGRMIITWLGVSFDATIHIGFTLVNVILLALIAYDKSNKLKYQPYLVILAAFVTYQISYYLLFSMS